MKTCITCRETKPLDAFGNYKRYADGKHRICRVCWNSYAQEWKHANGTKPYLPFLERFWQGIQQCQHEMLCPYCCWPWLKGRDKDGYGKFSIHNALKKDVSVRATRIVYELWHAVHIPNDQLACHYCDTPSCCNPSHLWLGSFNDNRQDCVRKGRTAKGLYNGTHTHPETRPRGEHTWNAKLTAQDVRDIRTARATGISVAMLATRYGVSDVNMYAILNREAWKHV